jgi:hypothetical protein
MTPGKLLIAAGVSYALSVIIRVITGKPNGLELFFTVAALALGVLATIVRLRS